MTCVSPVTQPHNAHVQNGPKLGIYATCIFPRMLQTMCLPSSERPLKVVCIDSTQSGPHIPLAALSARPCQNWSDNHGQHMAPHIALHKSKNTVYYHPAAAQPYTNKFYYETAASVHETHHWHIRHGARTYFTIWKSDSKQIHEFARIPEFTKLPIAKIKSLKFTPHFTLRV